MANTPRGGRIFVFTSYYSIHTRTIIVTARKKVGFEVIYFARFPVYNNRMKKEEIEILFRRHYSRMLRLAMRMLYDDEESRDVVSEVFATLIKTDILPKNIEGYLMASVRNRCLNLLEHKNVRAKFEQAYTLEMKQEGQEGDDNFAEQRLQQIMSYAKQHLAEQTLRVFHMRHIDGMKYQEIADQLGISRVMVYKHLAKAMNTIREYNNQKKYLEPLDKGRL